MAARTDGKPMTRIGEAIERVIPYFYIPLIAFLVIAALTAARSDGIYNPTGGQVGFVDGINNFTTSGAAPNVCSGTGLDFSQGCNSQYIGLL